MPSWTDPKTWATSDVLTAADLNTYVRDQFDACFPVGSYMWLCQAATSVETLVNGAWLECMPGSTSVALADGDTMQLGRIVQGKERREVVARAPDGSMVTGRVNGWRAIPAAPGEWRRVTAGGEVFHATLNHPIATQRGWVKVADLRPGDRAVRYQETLTYVGRQALGGIILGDGTISARGRFSTSHGPKQRAYLSFLASKLGVPVEPQGSCFVARKSLRRLDLEMSEITKARAAAALDPIGLAFWYMDDGHLCRDSRHPDYERAQFHTEGLPTAVVDALAARLATFGLRATKYGPYRYRARTFGSGVLLRLDRESSDRFFGIVAPYVEPSMRYKLPERHRVAPFVLDREPFVAMGFSMHTVSVAQGDPPDPGVKYDISVEDAHCFVGDGALVHNCNGVAVSRTTYAALNTLLSGLGYPFGSGNGTTTFNVPDLRGRAFVMHGTGSGHANVNALGDSDGAALASRTPQVPAHTHTLSGSTDTQGSHTHTGTTGGPSATGADNFPQAGSQYADASHTHSFTTAAGGSHSHSLSGGSVASGGSHAGAYLVAGIVAIKAL